MINQKFFIPGHSFDICDIDFGVIERSKHYHEEVYVPEKWERVIADAKKRNPKFQVHRMTSELFYSWDTLENEITNRKISENKQKVEWLKIRWLQFRKDEPKKLFYKTYSVSDCIDFDVVDIARKGLWGRPSRNFSQKLNLLYPRGRPITKEKKKDLMSLLKYIPPIYHHYYRNLKVEGEGFNNPDMEATDGDNE